MKKSKLDKNTLDSTFLEELISQVYQHSRHRFFINKKKEAELFSNLQLITQQKAIPLLLPLVFSHNKRLAKITATTLHQILLQTAIEEFIALDEMIAKNCSYLFSKCSFYKININSIKNLQLADGVSNSIFALLCSLSNGYIREAALKELSLDYPAVTIATLLIRSNDWVENIKNAATAKLLNFIAFYNIKDKWAVIRKKCIYIFLSDFRKK